MESEKKNAVGLCGIWAAHPHLSSWSCEWLTVCFTLYFDVWMQFQSLLTLPLLLVLPSPRPFHSLSPGFIYSSQLLRSSRVTGWVRKLN